jgi:cell division protein FtsB
MHRIPKRSRRAQALVLLSCLALTAYFSHHAINGRHGLEARKRLIERSRLLEFEIRSLEAVRARLKRDVALLSPDQPSPDFVDEIARDALGFAHPRDHILAGERR